MPLQLLEGAQDLSRSVRSTPSVLHCKPSRGESWGHRDGGVAGAEEAESGTRKTRRLGCELHTRWEKGRQGRPGVPQAEGLRSSQSSSAIGYFPWGLEMALIPGPPTEAQTVNLCI